MKAKRLITTVFTVLLILAFAIGAYFFLITTGTGGTSRTAKRTSLTAGTLSFPISHYLNSDYTATEADIRSDIPPDEWFGTLRAMPEFSKNAEDGSLLFEKEDSMVAVRSLGEYRGKLPSGKHRYALTTLVLKKEGEHDALLALAREGGIAAVFPELAEQRIGATTFVRMLDDNTLLLERMETDLLYLLSYLGDDAYAIYELRETDTDLIG